MIRPNKHSHPDKTVISVSAVILKRLKTRRSETFDELRDYTQNLHPEAIALFLPAVNLLFLLGLVEYHKKNDSFEYSGA